MTPAESVLAAQVDAIFTHPTQTTACRCGHQRAAHPANRDCQCACHCPRYRRAIGLAATLLAGITIWALIGLTIWSAVR